MFVANVRLEYAQELFSESNIEVEALNDDN